MKVLYMHIVFIPHPWKLYVDDGSTVTDFLPAERARGITIQSAAITFHWPPLPQESLPRASTAVQSGPRSLTPHTINLIDTPGHADFTFEVLRSLRVLDGAVCILDGVAGVEAQTEKVWHQASAYHIPRIIYINKLDRDGAAFRKTVQEIGSRLKAWPAVCQIPWWEKGNGRFIGVADVIGLRGLRWDEGGDGKSVKMLDITQLETEAPAFAQEIKKARAALVEVLSEHDDQMVEKFLEYDEDHLAIPGADLTESLRRCTIDGSATIAPVFAGASFRNIGVQPLLDAIVDLLPEAAERPDPDITLGAMTGRLSDLMEGKMDLDIGAGRKRHQPRKVSRPLASTSPSLVKGLECCALAFKVVNDPRRGVLVYVRVYSGQITRNALLYNTQLHVSERAPRLLRMYASDAVEIDSIPAGQIGVIAGLKFARTGDTLISYGGANPKTGPPAPLNTLQLRPIEVPPPVFFAGIEPASLSEEKHLSEGLDLLLREDPSLHVAIDEDSGQTLLSGMGDLHLEIARDRLINDFHAKASMGRIEIGYRETISSPAGPSHALFDRELASKKAKAGCEASVAPMDSTKTDTTDDLDGNQSSAQSSITRDGNRVTVHIPALLAPEPPSLPPHLSLDSLVTALSTGAFAALSSGPTFLYPVHDVAVSLTLDPARDLHGTLSTPAALTTAARQATRAALSLAATSPPGSGLMEPVMAVHISVDEAHLGAVVHDLSSARGGHILSLSSEASASLPSSGSPSATSSSSHTSSTAAAGASLVTRAPSIPAHRIYTPPDPFGSDTNAASIGTSTSNAAQQTQQQRPQRAISARVPLKEMVGYLKHLRSLTGGRGTFVMAVDRFERMAKQRERAVLAEVRGV
ncbi:MAG: Ribosome-releasing factor 2, mitochondrial [Thelocarpon superellum]|nr:MAG: Ribosome-releasing factor 2, mitochondrial [Thelocarpon superellum]